MPDLNPAPRLSGPKPKPAKANAVPALSFQETWHRTFSPGIRQAIFEGFAALFVILLLSTFLFFTLGVVRGYDLFDTLVVSEFDRQLHDNPDLRQSVEDYSTIVDNVHGADPPAQHALEEYFSLQKIYLLCLPLPLLALAMLLSQRITRSIMNLTHAAKAIENANWSYAIVVQEEDEIGELARAMEHMRRRIRSSQEELEHANSQLAEQLREQQYALQQARIIQGNFMPLRYQVKNATVASLFLPQQELSGDFFTFKELRGDRVAFIFGDIQGHGVPASLNMMSIVTSFRLLAEEYDDPALLAGALNMLCGHNASRGPMPLVTAVVGVIDQHDGTVQLVNAGHPSPLLVDASEREVREIAQRDPILGLMPDYRYTATRVNLKPEDKILCYTDGLVEATNADGDEFDSYFRETAAMHAFTNPDSFIEILRERIEQFLGQRPQADDILLSCISVEVAKWEYLEMPPLSRDGIITAIMAACAKSHVPNEVTSDIHLAIDELITNALVHGNQMSTERGVHVRYAIGHGVVRVAIKDDGPGFVPDLEQFHLTSEQLMERGRRGIYLVKSLMDEMHYNESGN
ncbi:MAG: SpoIIE family protein phosphatase, partial [bacterium]